MTSRRSYDLKIDWAEKHLVNLEWEIRSYCDAHPYRVRAGRNRKDQPRSYKLWITSQPDERIALIASDFLYNVRAAYDHLATAMVPGKYRKQVHFPILWQGVWDLPIEGESTQRAQARRDWITYTEHMPGEAVAILKAAQPPDPVLDEEGRMMHGLAMLNRLRNADAHRKLAVTATMLLNPEVTCEGPDGPLISFRPNGLGPNEGLSNDADIYGIPDGAVNVQINGTPHVVVKVGEFDGGFRLAEGFREQILEVARGAIDTFRPYVSAD